MVDDDLVLPPVAKNIPYYCKKCDAERYHVVTAHVSAISAKLECEVCKSKKTYKITEPKKGKKMTKKKTRKSAVTEAENHRKTYQAFHEKIGVANIQPYSMKSRFDAETAIDHPKFGVGFITTVMGDKIEVCFEESAKLLVHNRG